MTISSASRDRCVAADRRDRQEFQREVAVGDRIERIAGRLAEAERLGGHVAVDRKAGAGKRGGTDRAFVQMFDGVADAREVAAEHFDIGHAVVAEGHRLGGLQMGEAGHDGGGMLFGPVEEGGDQAARAPSRCVGSSALTQRRKSSATWSLRERAVCRRPAAGPMRVGEPRLDIHVDVFELARERRTRRSSISPQDRASARATILSLDPPPK